MMQVTHAEWLRKTNMELKQQSLCCNVFQMKFENVLHVKNFSRKNS